MLEEHPGRDPRDYLIATPGDSFLINGGDFLTYRIVVTLHCRVAGASMMRFRNDDGTWSDWSVYAERPEWRIENRHGSRRVEAEFELRSGDIVTMEDDIRYEDRITVPGGVEARNFGWSVSISSDGATVAAGAPDRGAGAAFVCDWTGEAWAARRLYPVDAVDGDRFGWSVSLSGDGSTVVVGSPDHVNGRGAAYLFRRDHGGPGHWGQMKKIIVPGGADHDRFGWSVSLSRDGATLIAGAPGRDDERGAACVFERSLGGPDAWGLRKTLTHPGGEIQDQFGVSVSVAPGTRAVVGAFWKRVGGNTRQGTAYVYDRDYEGAANWGLRAALASEEGEKDDYFGNSVALSGDGNVVVAGAWGDDVDSYGDDRGSLHVFERNRGGPDNWGRRERLLAVERGDGDRTGNSVAVSDDGRFVAAGAFQADIDGRYDQGAAYLFELREGVYVQTERFSVFEGEIIDRLGVCVALSADGDALAAGAYLDDIEGRSDEGSVFIFR